MVSGKLNRIPAIDEVVCQAKLAMEEHDFELALRLISKTMFRAFEVSMRRQILCFGSPELDDLCACLGKELWPRMGGAENPCRLTDEEGVWDIYVASDLYDSGGHTPLIGDYIRAASHRRAFLLVTDIDNRLGEVGAPILDYIGLSSSQVALCPETDLLNKFVWLKNMISRFVPNRVFLFNHPHDSVAVAACAALTVADVFFIHHVDRSPCLGAYLKSAIHVDVTPFCYHCCRDKARISGNIFIPLVAKDEGKRCLSKGRLQSRGLVTATAGTEHKFRLDYTPNYISVIAELLRVGGRRHVHIGHLSSSFLDRFRSQLREVGAVEDRFTYIPHVSSLWRAMADFDVDLYIGSFPARGARASVEVMGSGTPALWHVSTNETWFHDTHMKYPEAATWRTKRELLGIADSTDDDWVLAQSRAARRHYEANHNPELMAEQLSASAVSGRLMHSDAAHFQMPTLKSFNELRNSTCFATLDKTAAISAGKLKADETRHSVLRRLFAGFTGKSKV